MSRRVVVTGALGHIGSRLVRALPEAFAGSEIVMLDNLSTQRYGSLFGLPAGRYRFLQADVLDADLEEVFEGADAVVHLAAVADAEGSFDRREETERVNFQGAERVAKACLRAASPLIFASTTSVYGASSGVVDEDCPREQLRPQSPYAASKRRAELMLESLGAEGLRFVTCRFGTIFGVSPGMRFHTAVNKFVWQACMGQPLSVWRGALEQRRPYLDLEDAVRALVFIIDKGVFDGRTYNVLTANAKAAEIIDCIRPHVPDLRLEYVDSPIMNQLSYDVSRARFRSLGFEFSGDLRAAVAATVELLRGARHG